MHHRNLSFAMLALLALLAACSGGRDRPPPRVTADSGADLGGPADLGPFAAPDLGPRDLGTPDLGRRCVSACATNADCQTSCPSNPTPSLPVCCDRVSGTCFNSSVSTCPTTTPTDAGTPMSI